MTRTSLFIVITVLACVAGAAAENGASATSARAAASAATGDYATDLGVVRDAQSQALEQARAALEKGDNARDRAALQAAVKAMEQALAAIEQAKSAPETLPAALAAEQSAYQALLKATPREYRLSRSRSRSQGRSSSSGQPSQEELNQMEMTTEENRYETERQASATATPQQREQAQTVDRLKLLARRQQDLNERLRDLQAALKEAPTEKQREEIQRQLKRLRDEERQLLSDVDELRQNLERSPEAARPADARQQLEQTRSDVQRAAQNLEQQAVSEALAAGARAEQRLQNLRENLRQQTSSQFAEQMRQMRHQARDLSNRENEIARRLDELNNGAQKPLDDSAPRKEISQQLARQQSALTNLLGGMRTVTEQAETTEPLLSKQLYEVVRRADQAHTENQLDVGRQLVDRGFLPQASAAERSARQNLEDLRQRVDHAAESVLGSEAQALQYAQKELEDLARQMAGEIAAGTNSPTGGVGHRPPGAGPTNGLAAARGPQGEGRDARGAGTNGVARTDAAGERGGPGTGGTNVAQTAEGGGGDRPTTPPPGQRAGNRPGNPGEETGGDRELAQAPSDNSQPGGPPQGQGQGQNQGPKGGTRQAGNRDHPGQPQAPGAAESERNAGMAAARTRSGCATTRSNWAGAAAGWGGMAPSPATVSWSGQSECGMWSRR